MCHYLFGETVDEPAAMPQYKRPPITEAVIEIRFTQQLALDEVERLRAQFANCYPTSAAFASYEIKVDMAERQARLDQESAGVKLTSADQADVLLVMPSHFACSRLAPYVGWDAFRERAEKGWRTWVGVVGYREIRRIGVRYINRIDIPMARKKRLKIQDYLRVYPETGAMELLDSYAMQLVGPLGEDDCRLVVNSRTERPRLVDHASVVFDIDVSREASVPQEDQELWALIDRIRVHKNRVFEAAITDKARELFNR